MFWLVIKTSGRFFAVVLWVVCSAGEIILFSFPNEFGSGPNRDPHQELFFLDLFHGVFSTYHCPRADDKPSLALTHVRSGGPDGDGRHLRIAHGFQTLRVVSSQITNFNIRVFLLEETHIGGNDARLRKVYHVATQVVENIMNFFCRESWHCSRSVESQRNGGGAAGRDTHSAYAMVVTLVLHYAFPHLVNQKLNRPRVSAGTSGRPLFVAVETCVGVCNPLSVKMLGRISADSLDLNHLLF